MELKCAGCGKIFTRSSKRAYRAKEPSCSIKCRGVVSARLNKKRRKGEDHRAYHQKLYWLDVRYNLTEQQYRDKMDSQFGCCAICGTSLADKVYSRDQVHVDHNHVTGEVRGLLCGMCNKGIGCLQDSSEILKKALNYMVTYEN